MAAFTAVAEKDRGALSDNPNGITLVDSGAYTATASAEFSADQTPIVEAVIHTTAEAATASVVFCIQGYNEAAGLWETLIASAAVDAADIVTALQVNPYTPSVTNVSAQRVTRRRMRVTAEHSDADALTYSIRVYGVPR